MAPAIGFTLCLVGPSLQVGYRYFGVFGVVLYLAIASAALLWIHRSLFAKAVANTSTREAAALAAALVVFLVAAFAVGYPLANSGLIGPGSDRDEHLQLATTELLHGRYPYYPRGPFGQLISQLPGALILASPFALLGNASYQNVFWLPAFVAGAGWLLMEIRAAVLLLLVILALSPIVMNEFVVGGDLLPGSIYALVFLTYIVRVVPDRTAPGWKKPLAALALGLGLASRPHFFLLLPLVFSVLRQRAGNAAAVRYTGITTATMAAVILPFYAYDPAGFSPLHTAHFVQFELLPFSRILLPVAFGVVALLASLHCANGDLRTLLRTSACVLAVPIVTVFILAFIEFGSEVALAVTGYGLSFLFFGAVGFSPCELSRGAQSQPPPSAVSIAPSLRS